MEKFAESANTVAGIASLVGIIDGGSAGVINDAGCLTCSIGEYVGDSLIGSHSRRRRRRLKAGHRAEDIAGGGIDVYFSSDAEFVDVARTAADVDGIVGVAVDTSEMFEKVDGADIGGGVRSDGRSGCEWILCGVGEHFRVGVEVEIDNRFIGFMISGGEIIRAGDGGIGCGAEGTEATREKSIGQCTGGGGGSRGCDDVSDAHDLVEFADVG